MSSVSSLRDVSVVEGNAVMSHPPVSVALFTNTRVRAGVEEHILTLARGLDRTRFRLCLICPPELAGILDNDIPADVEVVRLDLSSPLQLGTALRLRQILRARQIDILHSHMFQSSLLASPVAWLSGVPVVLETSHGRENWRRGWFKSRFIVDRLAGRFVSAYIAVSQGCGVYLIQQKGLPARKVVVIPNGCDIDRFTTQSPAAGMIRSGLGISDDAPVLMVVGRLEPQKGHAVLLESLVQIRAAFPNVCLICVGEGSLLTALETRCGELGMAECVRFVGYQRNTEDWLAFADIVVLPSFYEGLPLVAIEALAAGRAMVATAVDGTSEVIIDGKTGLRVAAGDPHALADAICRLLRNPAERRTLGATGQQWVLERYRATIQIRSTEQLYLRLLGQYSRSSVNKTTATYHTESRI